MPTSICPYIAFYNLRLIIFSVFIHFKQLFINIQYSFKDNFQYFLDRLLFRNHFPPKQEKKLFPFFRFLCRCSSSKSWGLFKFDLDTPFAAGSSLLSELLYCVSFLGACNVVLFLYVSYSFLALFTVNLSPPNGRQHCEHISLTLLKFDGINDLLSCSSLFSRSSVFLKRKVRIFALSSFCVKKFQGRDYQMQRYQNSDRPAPK